jgi:hypothetical protein
MCTLSEMNLTEAEKYPVGLKKAEQIRGVFEGLALCRGIKWVESQAEFAWAVTCTCSRNSHYKDQIGGFPGDFCTFLAMPQIGNKMLI